MDNNFEFKKLEKGKCAFIMHNENIERVETVSEEYARNHYKGLRKEKQELLNQLAAVNRMIDNTKVEKNDELEHFIELANAAGKYKKHLESVEQQRGLLKMLENINTSMSQIEKVLPEVKRMKQ